MAVAWILYRDIAPVRQWSEPQQQDSTRSSVTPSFTHLALETAFYAARLPAVDAWQDLLQALQLGKVTATAICPVSGKRDTICAVQFLGAQLIQGHHGEDQLIPGHYADLLLDRRSVLKAWPKRSPRHAGLASARHKCQIWLERGMRASPARRPKTRNAYLIEAKNAFPGLSTNGFDQAWKLAIGNTGADAWKAAGRPRKSSI